VIVRYLDDPSENVRGNAQWALTKILPLTFAYQYSDPPEQRKKDIAAIRDWWAQNGKSFTVSTETPEEKARADEEWEKHGRPLLESP